MFVAVLLGGCASPSHQLITKRPERWDAELSIGTWPHDRFFVEIHDYGRGFTEFVIRRGAANKPVNTHKILCVEKLSQSDLAFLYDAVLQTLQQFRFIEDLYPDRMDGGYAIIELRVNKRSLLARFNQFGDTAELPGSLQKIMKFADSRLAKRRKPKENGA
ncbi:MAG: hypothetical protein ABI680_09470 [Chthoniobacteraceae bacterium]